MFTREILINNRILVLHLSRKDTLFRKEQNAINLFYLMEGEIKIYNTDFEGKEFLKNKVLDYQFLGEAAFLLGENYLATAEIASETAEVFCLSEYYFMQYMAENPEVLLEFTTEIARETNEQTVRLKSIVHQCPNERIWNYLKIHKKGLGIDDGEKAFINITRKEMAHSTRLAVETVILTVKKMEKEEKLKLINHKIYF